MTFHDPPEPGVPQRSLLSALPTGANGDGRARVYLHAGRAYLAIDPTAIVCMLGSCVAVCLWDRKLKIGGAVHYLLPGEPDVPSLNSGMQGINELILQMRDAGANPSNLLGKIFGGACILRELRGNRIGTRNITAARVCLSKNHIAIVAESVGGEQGRKVVFHSDTGETLTRLIGK